MFPSVVLRRYEMAEILRQAGWTTTEVLSRNGELELLWTAPNCLERLPLEEAYQAWKLGKRCEPPLVLAIPNPPSWANYPQ